LCGTSNTANMLKTYIAGTWNSTDSPFKIVNEERVLREKKEKDEKKKHNATYRGI
jgi:hypothetical protein